MGESLGKKFEKKFKDDWEKTVSDSLCYRLVDVQGGYFGVSNVSDFICYRYPIIFLVECKSKLGNTFPFSDFRQYEKMLPYIGITGVKLGVVLWMIDHHKVLWIPIETFKKIKDEGGKSFNIKMLDNPDYEVLDLNAKDLRTFMSVDYNNLINYYGGSNE